MPDRMADRMAEYMSKYISKYMSGRMQEYMSDRMPEYIKVKICPNKNTSWHVMLGITRSKVMCSESVVVFAACMPARKCKTLTREAWAMAGPKQHPNPARYHVAIGQRLEKKHWNTQKQRNWPGSRVSADFCSFSVVGVPKCYTPLTSHNMCPQKKVLSKEV